MCWQGSAADVNIALRFESGRTLCTTRMSGKGRKSCLVLTNKGLKFEAPATSAHLVARDSRGRWGVGGGGAGNLLLVPPSLR